MAELTDMATAMSFDGSGGGGSGGTLIEKFITENGTYNASDDNADGYSIVHVRTGDVQELVVTENGWYDAYEYDCDGFNPVIVNVHGNYTFCDDKSFNDISSILDFELNNYQNYLYDVRVGFGVRASVENNGHTLKLYKVATDGTETQVYSDTSVSDYSNAYIEIVNSSTGQINIKYDLSGQPTTVSETISAIEQYGGDDHGFMVLTRTEQ